MLETAITTYVIKFNIDASFPLFFFKNRIVLDFSMDDSFKPFIQSDTILRSSSPRTRSIKSTLATTGKKFRSNSSSSCIFPVKIILIISSGLILLVIFTVNVCFCGTVYCGNIALNSQHITILFIDSLSYHLCSSKALHDEKVFIFPLVNLTCTEIKKPASL